MVQSVITTRFLEKHLVIPWRIHEFLAGGGGKPYYFGQFLNGNSMKMKQIERGGAQVLGTPLVGLDPLMSTSPSLKTDIQRSLFTCSVGYRVLSCKKSLVLL